MDSVTELTEEVAAMGSHMFRVRLPFVAELRRYSWEKFRSDLVAGATVTLVSIPQAIGFSLILNLPPQPVIISVIIGGFVGVALLLVAPPRLRADELDQPDRRGDDRREFGDRASRRSISQPTSPFLIGVIQLLAGLLNFGEITKFISRSVVVAYSTGIGILLIASQLHNLLGYDVEAGQNFSTNVLQAIFDLGTAQVHPWAIGIGALTFAIFWAGPEAAPRVARGADRPGASWDRARRCSPLSITGRSRSRWSGTRDR